MSKQKFTRSFNSLADFADQFGTAYVEAAISPGQAAERIHQAPATTTVVTQDDIDRHVKKQVAKMMRQLRGGKKGVNRAVSKSKSRRVRKVM